VLEDKGNLAEALREFELAVALRPRDYVFWYELALVRDNAGDREGAIAACQQSVRLAPYYGKTHWLLGNLLFRAGQREEAFAELRIASASDAVTLPHMIDLAWGTSQGDVRALLDLVQPQNDAARLTLAQYLARKGKYREAIELFRAAGTASEDERKKILQSLLSAHRFKEAYEVWSLYREENKGESSNGTNTITDPGFEGTIKPNEPGFGWQQPGPLENVRISLDATNPRSGDRSLHIEFNGNSNPSGSVITQIVLVEPDTHYKLHFAARMEDLITGGPPQIAVEEAGSAGDSRLLAALALPLESGPWRDYAMSFSTAKDAQAIIIHLNRQGCSSSPCPAFGRVWLDAFALQKQAQP
jgi:hypothetical protein